MIRLDKYLADMGIGTRSEVKKNIIKGMVTVNAVTVKKPEYKIDTTTDTVFFQEQEIGYVAYEYFMLNKPAGVISATEDKREETVIDLIEGRQRKDLFPVGRLDKDTEGLLLITNDGALAHRLLSPKKHVDKQYYATVQGIVTDEDVKRFAQGLDIGDSKPTLPAELRIVESGSESIVEITIREGRYHQIKRMFEAVDKKVLSLKRLAMGSLQLDSALKPGEYRKLTEEEKEKIC